MKKPNLIILFLGLIISFSSCTEKINTCTLSKVTDGNGDLWWSYSFSQNKLTQVGFYSSGTLYFSWEIYYNDQNQMDHVDFLNYLNGFAMERAIITRNSDENVNRVYYWNDANYDMIPETMTSFKEFVYNADKKVQEEKLYNAPNSYSSSIYYTWSNNNIIRKDDNNGHMLYTYDNKKSRYGGLKDLFYVFSEPFYLLSSLTFLSDNNVLTIDYFDIGDNLITSDTYNYTYNADGYPESASSPFQLSYEYNCVAE